MNNDHDNRKRLIRNYLGSLGFPNMRPEMVIMELPTMWQLMADNNLLPSIEYSMFCEIVVHQFNQERMLADYYYNKGIERVKLKKKG